MSASFLTASFLIFGTALRIVKSPSPAFSPSVYSPLSFNRDGQVAGQPLITYENPQPSQEGRAAMREALEQARVPPTAALSNPVSGLANGLRWGSRPYTAFRGGRYRYKAATPFANFRARASTRTKGQSREITKLTIH